jgi:intein/homing endonuclease
MADGSSKHIEDVQVGDEVITHDGMTGRVSETFVNNHDGELFRLKVKNKPALLVTKEHPFLSIANLSTTKLSSIKAINPSVGWVETKDLVVGDILVRLLIRKLIVI